MLDNGGRQYSIKRGREDEVRFNQIIRATLTNLIADEATSISISVNWYGEDCEDSLNYESYEHVISW